MVQRHHVAGLRIYFARVSASQMPPPIMKPPEMRETMRVRRAEKNIRARPDVKEKLATLGFKPVANTPDEWSARIKLEIEKWGKVVKDAGLRIE